MDEAKANGKKIGAEPSRLRKALTANLRGTHGETDGTFAVMRSDGPTSRRSAYCHGRGNR